MSNLATTYMGIELANPVVVAASTFSAQIDTVREIADLGAGALVIKSLFEEQVLHEVGEMEDVLTAGSESFAEALTYLPLLEHAGAREHLVWIERTRAAVKMPLIGSVNAVHAGKWADYARQMAETGVDAIELNVYAVEADPARNGADVENRLFETFEAVRSVVRIPVAVKLSPFYSGMAHVIGQLEKRGANGVVLFNRFLQPEIDIETETVGRAKGLSRRDDMRLPLRWIALLYGRVGLDLIGNTGVEDASDIVRYLLAGATAVQVASALYRGGVGALPALSDGVSAWMAGKGYGSIGDFRGKVSQKDMAGNLYTFERAQYVDYLLSAPKE